MFRRFIICASLLSMTLAACGGGSSGSGPAPGSAAYINPMSSRGVAANTPCASSGKNAFTTYGASAFVAVNEKIFANVSSEIGANGTANLGTAFTLVGSGNPPATLDKLATFKGNLAAFLVYTFGGPASITYTDGVTYQGPQDMAQAHVGLHITSSQYDYFLTNIIVPALTAQGVPAADVSSCFAPALTDAGFKALIVNDGTGTGLGAGLACAGGKNAFGSYGVNAFVAVNEQIFSNVTSELTANSTANLGSAFTKIGTGNPPSTADGLAAFKGNLAAFLVYTYGGPSIITYTDGMTYYGPQDMSQSHAGLGIASSQYDYFVSNVVVPALTAKGVSSSDVSACFAPPLLDAGFKASIVGQ